MRCQSASAASVTAYGFRLSGRMPPPSTSVPTSRPAGIHEATAHRPRPHGTRRATGQASLLGERDAHGVCGRDLEALQGGARSRRLGVRVELHEGDVVPARDQSHLLEAGEPAGAGRVSQGWRRVGTGQWET